MAEYIKREAAFKKCGWYNTVNGKSVCAVRKDELASIPAADVVEVPQEYACSTDFDDENFWINISFPISEKQFKALAEGADLWAVLRGGSDG